MFVLSFLAILQVIPLVELFLVMSYMFLLFGISSNFDRMLDILMIPCWRSGFCCLTWRAAGLSFNNKLFIVLFNNNEVIYSYLNLYLFEVLLLSFATLIGHKFEQTLGDGEVQESLVCCGPWCHKELDPTEWLSQSESRVACPLGVI